MRKKLLLVLVMLVVATLPAACSYIGEDTPATSTALPMPAVAPTAKDERVTILFAVDDQEKTIYEDLIQVFEEANPGLRVQLVSIDATLGFDSMGGDRRSTDWELRLASVADVVNQALPPGLARDLTPFIEADSNFQPADFGPDALEFYRWDGSGILALPIRGSLTLIYYDKDIFDEMGMPYPEPGWTWEDFLVKARALTAREGDTVTCWGFAQPWPDHLAFVESRIGSLIDNTSELPTPRFDQPEVIEAVRWYADLYLKEQVTPNAKSDDVTEALIDEGRVAMWPDDSTQWWWWRSQQRNVGTAPFPVDTPDSRTTPIWLDGISMSAGTSHPDAAWRWMVFLSRQVIPELGSVNSRLPARRSVAEASGFWEMLDEELATVLRYAVDHSYGGVGGGGRSVYWVFLQTMEETILNGKKSVEEAMVEAQAQAQAKLQEEATRLAEATPVPPFVVAPSEEQKPASEGVVTITFIPGPDVSNLQRYRDLARRFHETHPDVIIVIKVGDFSDSHSLSGLANDADCFLGYPSFQDPESRAVILNLEPFLDADSLFTTDDFYSPVLEQFIWQGQLRGLPAGVEPYIIEYNKDSFDAAGLDYPALDWTTDDFLSLAMALTQGEGQAKQYGFVPEAYEANTLPLILERLGARLVDRSADPPAFLFDAPATVRAMRWYADLSKMHDVKPVFVTDMAELTGEVFKRWGAMIEDGRAAMWASSSDSEWVVAGDYDRLNIGVVPFPTGPNATDSYLSAQGYFISAQTEARQACWEWITFLTKQPEAVQGLPVRRSVAESEAYRQQVGDERATAYRASVAGQGRPFQIFSEELWLRGATYLLFQAYGQVLEGEASVERALSTAQRKADDYRTCVMARDAFYHQEDWKACLKEVDSTLLDFLFSEEE